jgi:hypothetical protein
MLMRYLTKEWWGGVPDPKPLRAYHAYLSTICDRLPPTLLSLTESASLHDGALRELDLMLGKAALTIHVDGDTGDGGARHFVLHYSGVTRFRSFGDVTQGVQRGLHGYGSWGYDEADITDSGEFEHRILFSSGTEIGIRFAGFEAHWQDA